ncbi:gluconokinase [Haliangium sp.]|uniref:gluconokinase n=1 Tax=Haliangium sp. TaxID=2663208 RepID=UPI003D126764
MVVIVMGVAGSGKSTVGRALAEALGWGFCDGDDLHSAESKAKMARGEALDDGDRGPWLARVRDRIEAALAEGRSLVIACSALRHEYRDRLGVGAGAIELVYLRADEALLRARLTARRGHFFPPALLASQLATLEAPTRALVVDAARPVHELVVELAAALVAGSAGR